MIRSLFKYSGRVFFIIICLIASLGCHSQPTYNEPISKLPTFLNEHDFNSFFPIHNTFYSFKAFKKAISKLALIKIKIEKRGDWIYKITRTENNIEKIVRQDKDWNEPWAINKPYSVTDINYNDFCSSKNLLTDKKEIAAFFAHVAHETRNGKNGSFNDGLMLVNEKDTSKTYIIKNVIYPSASGKKYYGRGPLQLSYNGNYGFASECVFGDKNILLNNPDLLSADAVVSFETAIFFWMTPQGIKPSPHQVITNQWKLTTDEQNKGYVNGFGMTINIINGSVECGVNGNSESMKNRIDFYQHFLKLFKIKDDDCACSCSQMVPFAN